MSHQVDSLAYAVRGLLDMQERQQVAFEAAVSAELVACTLGQRVRPELRVMRTDASGVVTRIVRRPAR